MSTYSFYTYDKERALAWARRNELAETTQAIAKNEPVANVVRALLRDAGVRNPDNPEGLFIPGRVWQVCQWLHDCPIPSFITGVVKDHGRNLINPEATLLGSQIERLGDPNAAFDFALYVPDLTCIVQKGLREIVEQSGNASLLFSFDRDIEINPW